MTNIALQKALVYVNVPHSINVVRVTFAIEMEVVSILVWMTWIVMNLNIATKTKRFVFQNATAIKNVLKVYFVWQMGRVQISVKITIIVQEDKYV